MEGLQKFARTFSKDGKSGSSSSFPEIPYNLGGVSSSLSSADQPRILATRPPRNMVSMLTCSKLCAICFAAGVVVGFTLKRRLRRWASNLLRRLKDD